ncbi:MAG TPA: redox-sensing transcriptional repressor Rex [Candidatus Ornithospirochaeta avicola]|uniref:Redox-sensing transcriptional repressor Rex n=1 Tax=Candidatus Ornithospirochaeta avicola TaxID=2840896 RepID=A0A9D1PSP5_9SPIO|nr:redox-sensing transcriptional repressor Rex [Candidatus Ornithospirochaeta avicola]
MNSDMLGRITRYYRALNRLRSIGLEKVFAHNLADAAGVSAAIVRKDFSLLSIHGQKRGGYEIEELIKKLAQILGKGESENVIIIGCGRIGKALMHYSGFEPDGIRVVAGFDSDPLVYADASNPIPVYPMSRLEEVVEAMNVKVAIITVPENAAADCYSRLVETNIEGILNFTPVTLKSRNVNGSMRPVVHNINIALELEQIFYEIQFLGKED